MDKVKSAITDFTSRSGHHDTTVHEAVAPAVTNETVKPHQHENIHTAIDKEVHQDHYHRTVQPIHHREVLPEQHTAKLGDVQHREFDNRDHDTTKSKLVQEQAQFKDQTQVHDTTHSRSVAPTVGGEHVHHHIHETIQPVVHKETVQPNVVHTTVPIHEVHHNKAQHHEHSTLPAMTMDEFKNKGGSLTGREERYDEFQGVPKNIGSGTGGLGSLRESKPGERHIGSEHHRHGDFEQTPNHRAQEGAMAAGTTTAASGTGLMGNKSHEHRTGDRDMLGAGASGHHVGTDGKIGTAGGMAAGTGAGAATGTSDLPRALTEDKSRAHHSSGHHDSNTKSKPSLMDKLNPKKDADGDGKAGFMK